MRALKDPKLYAAASNAYIKNAVDISGDHQPITDGRNVGPLDSYLYWYAKSLGDKGFSASELPMAIHQQRLKLEEGGESCQQQFIDTTIGMVADNLGTDPVTASKVILYCTELVFSPNSHPDSFCDAAVNLDNVARAATSIPNEVLGKLPTAVFNPDLFASSSGIDQNLG